MDEDIVGIIVVLILALVILAGICITCIVDTKIEAEKEIRLKAMEVYGEDYKGE